MHQTFEGETSIHQRFLLEQPALESQLGERLTIDGIAGPLRMFQRAEGQRHSIDDAATAWYALEKSPLASSALDLGTGVGSVGLAVLWGLAPCASLTCIEAQEISFKILRSNIRCNGLERRTHAIHGDLRNLSLDRRFPLITASPPYFPPTSGVLPADEQKAYARFELRGDVSDYARTAKRHLETDGLFVFCFPARQKERCRNLVQQEGFHLVSMRDFIPRAGKPPLFSVYAARLTTKESFLEEQPIIISGADGRYTDEMIAVQSSRGFRNLGENTLS